MDSNSEYAANPAYFESIRAIEEGNVYSMPSTNSAGPNITYLLMNAYYAGTVLFPDSFSDIDFRGKSSEIMEMMLGRDFFDEMESDGLVYGKLEVGVRCWIRARGRLIRNIRDIREESFLR